MAVGLVESGRAGAVLLCAAEALSRITDHDDRGTAVIFGDGCGAVVVAARDFEHGVGKFVFGSDASNPDLLYANISDRKLRMEGREVYRHAVARMVESTTAMLELNDSTIDDIDLFVPHQANARIVEAAARELGLPDEKVVLNMDLVANTSSASIPLALARAEADGRLQPGMTLALAVFAAGFVWGSGIVRWRETPLSGR
jgi:3-oxoacyl-[acyl-carrier-protein] synthase-3